MLRRMTVAGLVMATLAVQCADLSACGDKFLRAGRSARFRQYAATHPSSILLYAPAPAWTTKGVRQFEAMLTKAGHRPVAIRNASGIAGALGTGKYDLVIALYGDATTIRAHLETVSVRPAVLPVLYKPNASVAAEAGKTYQWIIRVDKMDKFQALEKIDELLGQRSKRGSAVAGTN